MSTAQTPLSYLLLDGAQIDQLVAQIYTLEAEPSLYLLYQHSAYAALAEVGPVLVRVEPHTPLAAHFSEWWQGAAGIWLESSAETADLVDHLRSLIHLRTEGDVSLLFRYYDPRILHPWLTALDSSVRDTVLGPINSIRLLDEQGHERAIERRSIQPFARYDDRPWLFLSLAQLQAITHGRDRVLDQRLLAHVQAHFPQVLDGLDAGARYQWAASCRQRAISHGYSTASEVCRWAVLVALLGMDFPQGAGHQTYRDALMQPGSPCQRLDSLVHLLQSQLPADKEATA